MSVFLFFCCCCCAYFEDVLKIVDDDVCAFGLFIIMLSAQQSRVKSSSRVESKSSVLIS